MTRKFSFLLPALLCLFLAASYCQAAELQLADPDAGYSLTLPDGWQPMDEAQLTRTSQVACNMLEESAKKKAQEKAKGAQFTTPDNKSVKELTIVYFENKALDMDKAALKEMGKPDSPMKKDFIKMMVTMFTSMGLEGKEGDSPSDGLTVVFFVPEGAPKQAAGMMQFRFTPEHTIVVTSSCTGEGAREGLADLEKLVATMSIAPEKQLGTLK